MVSALLFMVPAAGLAGDGLDFNRDIRPILSENCFHCHGPDAEAREAELRLDTRQDAIADRGGYQVLAPGDPEGSKLYRRITTEEDYELMPPPESKRSLTDREKALLRQWIASGGDYAAHWAWVAPQRPTVPAGTGSADASADPIDAFVRRRLQQTGLQPSAPASPEAQLRRLSLDLIGLPPSPEELQAFLQDYGRAPEEAYEAAVDRLLASPHFGERWARLWLDLARYADSNGFQADQLRDSWPYRDWVIDAINANLPFDEFTVEQLAGDLLPDASLDQRIATGFHRTVPCNVEAGVHPEENRTNQVVDRVNTTATVWLGVTMECVQCHNHKYDPFTMEDYYSLFAYFNNTPLEVELPTGTNDVSHDFVGPFLDLPLRPEQAAERDRLNGELAELEETRGRLLKEATHAFLDKHDPQLQRLAAREEQLEKQLGNLKPPRTLVMVELESPRETHVLNRGNYLDPGPRVQPRTPRTLHPLDPRLPQNRLGLARWLVSRANPLVARVTVNRWWAALFGRGIVATLEDFGTQCEPPTHPDLLDWLAVEFMDSGWDRKHLLKQIVMSRTYRQDSRMTAELRERDPENRQYARGPRFRLNAERIRDAALSASGLLSAEMHGPPVMPSQPPGIWRQVGRNEPKWVESKDEDRWRRGIYIVYRRAAPYPSMVNFDAPDRGVCTVKRPRTNTPLQALTLLNDPAYVEMALALADRILTESPGDDIDSRLGYAYRVVLSRRPDAAERQTLADLIAERRRRFQDEPQAAQRLVAGVSEVYRPEHADLGELAAWFYVANVLLNLDETVTKG